MSLQLFIGPMYAGKSSELIRQIQRYEILKKNLLVINHTINNRYGSNTITTHNLFSSKSEMRDDGGCAKGVKHISYDDCIIVGSLGEIAAKEEYKKRFEEADVIVIEELQFFGDAYDNIVDWCDNHGKHVIAGGLDGDFRRQPFGDVLRLIPHAESVVKLSALCKRCCDGTPANFTMRTTADQSQTVVGSADVYEAVCRKHFLENERRKAE
jgi:thymidine kinase